MTYHEYKTRPAGWLGWVEDHNGKPYIWVRTDGTWKFESQINRGPFNGDQEAMLKWMEEEGFFCGEAKCMACGRVWTAVLEDDSSNGELECLECGEAKGIIFKS